MRGEREYGWAWAATSSYGDVPVRALPARRSIEDPSGIAYYLCFHHASVERDQIVRVAD